MEEAASSKKMWLIESHQADPAVHQLLLPGTSFPRSNNNALQLMGSIMAWTNFHGFQTWTKHGDNSTYCQAVWHQDGSPQAGGRLELAVLGKSPNCCGFKGHSVLWREVNWPLSLSVNFGYVSSVFWFGAVVQFWSNPPSLSLPQSSQNLFSLRSSLCATDSSCGRQTKTSAVANPRNCPTEMWGSPDYILTLLQPTCLVGPFCAEAQTT